MINKDGLFFRTLLHIPVGILSILLYLVHWSLLLAFTFMFREYELNADRHINDQAWKDICGWLVGAGIMGSILLIRRYL